MDLEWHESKKHMGNMVKLWGLEYHRIMILTHSSDLTTVAFASIVGMMLIMKAITVHQICTNQIIIIP